MPHAAPAPSIAGPAWLDRDAYPFALHGAQLREGRLSYVDEGHGEPVLLSHGTPTWSFEYRHVIRVLSTRRRCIAPDHLGFGLSDRPAGVSYAPEAHAARLREFVDATGLGKFALVAHDYGGPVALPLALDCRVTRLVLINTWMWPLDDDAGMRRRARIVSGAFGQFMYRWMNASLRAIMPSAFGDRRKLTARIHAQYLAPFANRDDRALVLWPLAKALLGSRDFYAGLEARAEALRRIPTLIIWGMKDTAFRPHLLKRWERLLPGAGVHRIDHAGHWPHEEAPSEVAEEVARFLGDGDG